MWAVVPSLYVAASLLHDMQAADLPEECWQLVAAVGALL